MEEDEVKEEVILDSKMSRIIFAEKNGYGRVLLESWSTE